MGIGEKAVVQLAQQGVKAQGELTELRKKLIELYIEFGWSSAKDGKTLEQAIELYKKRWR